ncbi:hypothetical protein [Pseudovibrio axinellae]|nr:hypothetical protein [Pseudovibrio axinellae]
MKALAKDHDQTIAKYVKQHSRTEFGSINAVRVAEKAPEDLIRSFLESTPISSFSVLRQMQAFHLCMERSLPQLSPKECQDLTVNALKYGHLSMVSELANASGLTIEQVHQCFTHSSPDGFIVILVGLGFKSRLLDQLLVRFWGTLLNINQMRDLQKAAASVSPQVAQDLIVSWTKITPVSRYHAIIEASKTCVHELKAQSAPHLREATATQHLASLKA